MLSDDILKGRIGETKSVSHEHKFGPFHQFVKLSNERGMTRLYDNCSVDIIIPYHGRYDLVRRALLSIIRHTQSNPYQVTLVDDGSTGAAAKEFYENISQAPQTKVIRLERHSGFGAAVNAGLAATKQPYVCVMHSDCEVMHMRWLEAMGEALVLNKDKNIRLVSARSDNPCREESDLDGIEAIKVEYDQFTYKNTDEEVIQEVEAPLPMYCFMCHRGLFQRVGPIKPYPYTWYENEEFFYRMKKSGFKQGIAMQSWIHHDGSETVNYLLKKSSRENDIGKMMHENRDRCLADLKQLYRHQ